MTVQDLIGSRSEIFSRVSEIMSTNLIASDEKSRADMLEAFLFERTTTG